MSRSYDADLAGTGGRGRLERGNTARRLELDATETRWDYARALLPVGLLCGTTGVSWMTGKYLAQATVHPVALVYKHVGIPGVGYLVQNDPIAGRGMVLEDDILAFC